MVGYSLYMNNFGERYGLAIIAAGCRSTFSSLAKVNDARASLTVPVQGSGSRFTSSGFTRFRVHGFMVQFSGRELQS